MLFYFFSALPFHSLTLNRNKNGTTTMAPFNKYKGSSITFVTYKNSNPKPHILVSTIKRSIFPHSFLKTKLIIIPTHVMNNRIQIILNDFGTVTIGSIPESPISHSLPYQLISSTDTNTVSFCPLDA